MKLTHIPWLVFIYLLVSTCYFSYHVLTFKKSLKKDSKEVEVTSGQKVFVKKIIDGDEVSVVLGDKSFLVRILGVRSFNPNVNEADSVAKRTFDFLKTRLLEREAVLVFDELKWDSRKRLLAYLHKDDQDIGQSLIEKGLALVYVKYPFSRMKHYLQVQQNAHDNQQGLWKSDKMTQRALTLMAVWRSEKEGN